MYLLGPAKQVRAMNYYLVLLCAHLSHDDWGMMGRATIISLV